MNSLTRFDLPPYKDTSLEDRPYEEWKFIPELTGYFMISNFGRIKRLERDILDSQGGIYKLPAQIRTAVVNKDKNHLCNDYSKRLQIVIQFRNNKYSFQVARLVYYCFIAPFNIKDTRLVVIPKNGDGLDIRPENLLLTDYHGKNIRQYSQGRQISHFTSNPQKLNEAISASRKKNSKPVSCYNEIGNFIEVFSSISAAAKKFGIEVTSISNAAKNGYCKAAGLYWRYERAPKIDLNEIQCQIRKTKQSYREKRGTKITQFDLNGIPLAVFDAKSEAANKLGISHRSISKNIKGHIGHAGGYLWKEGNYLECKSIGDHHLDSEISENKMNIPQKSAHSTEQKRRMNEIDLPSYKDRSLINRPGEIWVDLKDLEGYIQISNFGRIKRREREVMQSNGLHKRVSEAILVQSVLKAKNKTHQDHTYQLMSRPMIDGTIHGITIRRMVYYHFVETFDLDDSMTVIIPINGDGLDVRPDNLKKVSILAKVQKSVITGRMQNTFEHIDHRKAIYLSNLITSKKVSQYGQDGKKIKTFKSIHEAARLTGISPNRISDVLNGRGTTAGRYYWKNGNAMTFNIALFEREKKAHRRAAAGTKVSQYDLKGNLIAHFNSLQDAAEQIKCSYTAISAAIRGINKTAGGYVWKKGHHN